MPVNKYFISEENQKKDGKCYACGLYYQSRFNSLFQHKPVKQIQNNDNRKKDDGKDPAPVKKHRYV